MRPVCYKCHVEILNGCCPCGLWYKRGKTIEGITRGCLVQFFLSAVKYCCPNEEIQIVEPTGKIRKFTLADAEKWVDLWVDYHFKNEKE